MKAIKLFFTWLFFPIILLIKKRQKRIIDKVEEVTENYDKLIEEYNLIHRKESKLSKKERYQVLFTVDFLIKKGHLKVN
jgi:hypothetical protein